MHRSSRARCISRATLVAFLLTSGGAALAPSLARADEEISDDARRHFNAGVAFLLDPDGERPEEAYREFKLAYALSKSPKVLGNLGLSAMKLERDGEAIDAFKRYAMEVSDIDEDERHQLNRDIATLTASAVRITVKADAPQTTFVDTRIPVRGAPITNVYGPVDGTLEIMIRTGHHRIQAKAGAAEAEWELDAAGGTRVAHDFHLSSASPPVGEPAVDSARARSRTGPIVMMGLGGAMLATAAVTGIVALGKVDDLERTCPRDECPAGFDYAGARSSARTFIGITDILLLGGGLVTAGGAAWLFFSGDSRRAAAPAATTSGHE